jgi:hypothetical protein
MNWSHATWMQICARYTAEPAATKRTEAAVRQRNQSHARSDYQSLTCHYDLAPVTRHSPRARGVAHCEHGRDRNPLAGGDNVVNVASARPARRRPQAETATVTKSEHSCRGDSPPPCRFGLAGSRTRLPAGFGTDFPGLSSPRLNTAGTQPHRGMAEQRGQGGLRWRRYKQY